MSRRSDQKSLFQADVQYLGFVGRESFYGFLAQYGGLVQLGIRQSRYLGKRKTLFQALMAATVANLALLAGPKDGKLILDVRGAGEEALLSFLFAILAGLGPVGAALTALLTALSKPQRFPAAAPSIPLYPQRSPYQLFTTPAFRPNL